MEEKFQKEEGISLMDIIRLLLSKIKLLILVVLIGGLLGGAFAVWRTYDVVYYGTSVEFYVNPEKPANSENNSDSQYGVYGAYGKHVMDNMVKLLASESFAEQLILNGEALPEKGKWVNVNNPAEVELGLDGLIDEAVALISSADAEQSFADGKQEMEDTALTDLQAVWKAAVIGTDYENYSYSEAVYERALPELNNTIALVNAHDIYIAAKEDADKAQESADEAKETANDATEKALNAWRETASYKSALSSYAGAVSYSYLQSNEELDDADNIARSFIYVKISVLNNRAFAENLLERVKVVVPAYVEKNMAVPSGYNGTNCQRITRNDNITRTNPGYTTSQAIKYGILLAAAALVVACIIIIVVDKSDKRLRDCTVITAKFNIPVLGVVPAIEDNEAPKKNDNKTTEVK